MRQLSVCAFALYLGLASPALAASVTTRFSVKGNTAAGVASHGDECGNRIFSIEASDELTKDGSGPTSSRSAFIAFFGFDTCLQINWGGGAAIPVTVPLDTSTVSIPFDFTVDVVNPDTDERSVRRVVGTLTIAATGDFEKSRDTTITQTGNVRVVTKLKGTTREAVVTVSATFDGVPLTIDPGTGSLGSVKQGTVEYVRH